MTANGFRRYVRSLRASLRDLVVKMLASTLFTFAFFFVIFAVAGLAIQVLPFFTKGRYDADPLSILIFSLIPASLAALVRIAIMKKFAKIKI